MSAAQQFAAHAAASTKSFAAGIIAAKAGQLRAAQPRTMSRTKKQNFSFSDAFAAAGYVALSAYLLALIVNAALVY
jgi:hypothetical protein